MSGPPPNVLVATACDGNGNCGVRRLGRFRRRAAVRQHRAVPGRRQRQQRGQRGRHRHGRDQPDRADQRRDDLLRHHLEVGRLAHAEVGGAEQQQDRQRRSHVGEHERVHGRAHVVAPHVQRAARTAAGTRSAGFARRSASTVDAWLIVTSSSTPSAPITIPARSSPWSETSALPIWRKIASSLDSPVRCVRFVKRSASSAVRTRLAARARAARRGSSAPSRARAGS